MQYVRSPYVAQAFIYGDSLQSHLVGIIVPDFEVLSPFCKAKGLGTNMREIVANPRVKAIILESIKEESKKAGLAGFEIVRDIFLSDDAFSVQNNILTPSFKLKRPQAKAQYDKHIRAMYAKPQVESKL
eukprot:Opistho-2@55367